MADKLTFTSKLRKGLVIEIDGHDFALTRRVPGITFLEFVTALKALQDSTQVENLGALSDVGIQVRDMFESVMEPEEFERFWKFSKSVDGPDFDTLVEILGSVVAADTDRPTKRPSRSARGPRTTGST